MKRGRRWAAAMLAVWMVLALAGCGASTGAAAEATASVSMADSADAAGGYGMSNGTAMPAAVEEAAETDAGEAGDSGTIQERKMIHRAELELETTDFDQAVADLADLTERMGGYYESSTVADRGSDYRWANYTIRVPADQYSAFLDQAGTLCHETWRNTTQDDVSEAYYDVQGRLTTQRVKLERLQALLEQAENMEDIITIESAISETQESIDRLSGSLQHYDSMVDYATVYINLNEVYQLSTVQETPAGFAQRLGNAFAGGWRGFLTGMESLVVALAYGWMWILLLAVIVAVVIRLGRRRSLKLPGRTKQADKPDDKPPQT